MNKEKKASDDSIKHAEENLDDFIHKLELAQKSQFETINLLVNSIDATVPDTDAQKVLTGIASLYVKIKENIDTVAIAQEKYNQDLISAKELEKVKQKAQIDTITGAIAIGQQAINGLYEVAAAKRQEELQRQLDMLSTQRDAELANKSLTEEQKSAIEERYRQKEIQLKKAAYLKERQAKISQAVINGLLAVTNALATAPTIIAGVALAAVAAATTAVQVSKIKSEPIPQFKKGTRKAPEGYALVGEEGPELVRLNGGERIWSYKQSEKIQEAWKGGSTLTPDQILAGYSPKADNELIHATSTNKFGMMNIDYELMAESIGDSVAKKLKIPEAVQVHNVIDEDGLALFVQKKGNRTKILNKYYKK
ncbi:hypothetical protein DC498_17685 [Terrimonas sp.]|uniref:hypothetical protein n=1 Tax=Terrimonas sp. TaxID=1914338 RepID=UPI000D519D66|nr:hypothetical protein [Terrimonas sp.]PVD50804.1 hypothetical protein DC498_17685 [Terrimonas sp.]